jgi:S-adenosylmethionine synthetase
VAICCLINTVTKLNRQTTEVYCGVKLVPENVFRKIRLYKFKRKNMNNSLLTSESVCSGHPDKICDQISDAIVDEAIRGDKYSRVAVDTLVTKNFVVIAGEITTNAKIDYKKLAKQTIKELGYTEKVLKFTEQSPILVKIHSQSNEIAKGVNGDGAGDQGMMYGYACNETKEMMPLPITIANNLVRAIDEARVSGRIKHLRPDGKAQVTIKYENDKPKEVVQVVMAVPHESCLSREDLKEELYQKIVVPVLAVRNLKIKKDRFVLNGTGIWHLSGPVSDTGLTGRKIIVDTYGGIARAGGGAFSGKDPTKVDRSGAYAARYFAKNIVANKFADRCEVRLAYYIGAKKPIMIDVETFGTEKKTKGYILGFLKRLMTPSVSEIIKRLNLRQPIYKNTACYGHFGRDEFPWEAVVKV